MMSRAALGLAVLLMAALLLHAAWLGASGQVPVGSAHGGDTGLDQVIAFLRAQPPDAIVYYHSLGWSFDYYLFDAPQERRWYGSISKLARDASDTARSEPARPQWLALPEGERASFEELRPALATHGLTLSEAGQVYRPDGGRSFTLYRVTPRRSEVGS